MADEVDLLVAEAATVGVAVGTDAARALLAWLDAVATAPVNVSGIRERTEARRKHLVDSLSCLPLAGLEPGQRCVDLGSGGGFPGVPVAILRPEVRMVLVDAAARKVAFLRSALAEAGLERVEVLQARAEALGRAAGWRESVDCVLARAVAPLPVLAEYGLPLCRLGGRLIALKGPRADEEAAAAARAVSVLGGELGGVRTLVLPGGGGRVVVRVDKVRPTPARYPRPEGTPSRRPL